MYKVFRIGLICFVSYSLYVVNSVVRCAHARIHHQIIKLSCIHILLTLTHSRLILIQSNYRLRPLRSPLRPTSISANILALIAHTHTIQCESVNYQIIYNICDGRASARAQTCKYKWFSTSEHHTRHCNGWLNVNVGANAWHIFNCNNFHGVQWAHCSWNNRCRNIFHGNLIAFCYKNFHYSGLDSSLKEWPSSWNRLIGFRKPPNYFSRPEKINHCNQFWLKRERKKMAIKQLYLNWAKNIRLLLHHFIDLSQLSVAVVWFHEYFSIFTWSVYNNLRFFQRNIQFSMEFLWNFQLLILIQGQ